MATVTHKDFRRVLLARFDAATRSGDRTVVVSCYDIRDEAERLAGVERQGRTSSHTNACAIVMLLEAAEGKAVVEHSTESGRGERLTIRYGVPRHPSPFGTT